MLTEEEVKRLYRIHKTLMQMLKDRGYFIADSELTMTKQQFMRKHGDHMKREDLVTLKVKRNDNSDQVCIICLFNVFTQLISRVLWQKHHCLYNWYCYSF